MPVVGAVLGNIAVSVLCKRERQNEKEQYETSQVFYLVSFLKEKILKLSSVETI